MAPARLWNVINPIPSSLFNGYRSVSGSEGAFMTHELQSKDRRNRRFLTTLGVSIFLLSALGLLLPHSSSQLAMTNAAETLLDGPSDILDIPQHIDDPYAPSRVLNGLPTMKFRDNLRPDKKYITSWISAGWTNDVMTYINLIYMGVITDRIPIIAMFTPSHIGGSVPPIPFSEVFDVPRLRQSLRMPVIEWREVKNSSSQVIDELGCWNVWEAVQYREHFPRRSVVPDLLSIDISYTKAPSWTKLIPNFEHDQHSTFWSLAVLAFPEGRRDNLLPPRESNRNHALLPPDEQVLCYDYLYYTCAQQPFEFNFDYSPAWRFVGQYMRWTPQLDALADQYVRRTVGVLDGEETPNWIAIHIRHGDFANWCGDVPVSDCFASLSIIARRVEEVREEILARKGILIDTVIMTSDERDDTWWDSVRSRGWLQVDHSQTAELYGAWYPVLIDAVIQSGGMGFVGTDRSTMSILARRRVQSWRDGVVRIVKWGRPGADDH